MNNDISNSTLAVLMIIAIIASVGGLYLSLTKLSQPPMITGFATTGGGQVNVTILNFNSIAIEDAQIMLGNCTPASGVGSNLTSNSTSADSCVTANSGTYPDNITVSNDGNTNLNVTVKSSIVAANLIGGSSPTFGFASKNASLYGGCSNRSASCGGNGVCGCNAQTNCTWLIDWQEFADVTTEYDACKNLTFGGTPSTRPRFYVFARVFIPADAIPRAAANATLTFTARSPSPT